MVITTKNRKEILVDDGFMLPIGYRINVASTGYARLLKSTGKKHPSGAYIYDEIYLHRYIMKPRKGYQVDHINGNRLDNRKENLRICVNGSNSRNKGQFSGAYKGVHFASKQNKWVAQITKNYKMHHLGTFVSPEDAAIAYNKAAKRLHGKYAFINVLK